MHTEVMRFAHACGVGDEWATWCVAPDHLGHAVLHVSKRIARFLKDARPDLSHSARLEAVSVACGFPHWHALQTIAQRMVDDFDPEQHDGRRPDVGEDRLGELMSAFPMLACASKDSQPSAEERHGMQLFGDRLSQAAGIRPGHALDLIARLNAADNWEALLARRPETSSEPLYSFLVEPRSRGGSRFVWSTACGKLVEQQDALFQGFDDRPASEQAACRSLLDRVTTERPDFLEGWLAKADIAEDSREQGRIYADAIARAEGLIPADFDGLISWMYIENRFYHRLLYGFMEWNILVGDLALALDLAKKQLRYNPDDNLGVRFFLPLLLLVNGQPVHAVAALDQMGDCSAMDAGPYFVKSLVFELLGKHEGAIQNLLHALFVFPPLRQVISFTPRSSWKPIAKADKRLVGLDLPSLLMQLTTVLRAYPKLQARLRRILRDSSVLAAERRLADRFWQIRSAWTSSSANEWEAEVERAVQETAGQLQGPRAPAR